MLNRRDFLQVAVATAAAIGPTGLARRAAAQEIGQAELLRFDPIGQVTLLHLTDIFADLQRRRLLRRRAAGQQQAEQAAGYTRSRSVPGHSLLPIRATSRSCL